MLCSNIDIVSIGWDKQYTDEMCCAVMGGVLETGESFIIPLVVYTIFLYTYILIHHTSLAWNSYILINVLHVI